MLESYRSNELGKALEMAFYVFTIASIDGPAPVRNLAEGTFLSYAVNNLFEYSRLVPKSS